MAKTVDDGVYEVDGIRYVDCCCCGKPLWVGWSPIHTRCIPKHWGKHAKGIHATRCREFGKKK